MPKLQRENVICNLFQRSGSITPEGSYRQKLNPGGLGKIYRCNGIAFAVINDDTNEVGSVHLGIVHRFDLDSDEVAPNEKALANLGFRELDELAGPLYEKLETWSAICVDALRAE